MEGVFTNTHLTQVKMKRWMEGIHTMYDVRDESGGTEGCGGGSRRLMAKTDNDDRYGSPSRQHKVTRRLDTEDGNK